MAVLNSLDSAKASAVGSVYIHPTGGCEVGRAKSAELDDSRRMALAAEIWLAYQVWLKNPLNKPDQEREPFPGLVCRSDSPVIGMVESLKPVARYPAPVLLEGEPGTGKELLARGIHGESRRGGEFVSVCCGALVADLSETEFFGHSRGAFTGADRARTGLFEAADKGAIFLDEIADLSPQNQAGLLRTLQERSVRPVGTNREREIDFRTVAATNKDLEVEVRKGLFRSDLYFRLNTAYVALPPLRKRLQDIPVLIPHFSRRFSVVTHYSEELFKSLFWYHWPGNVRELGSRPSEHTA